MGVVAPGRREVGGIGVEVLAALGTEVLRVRQSDVVGPAREEIPEVVEDALELAIAVGVVSTAGAGPSLEIAAASEDLGLGQILDPSDAFGGVGARFSGPWHGCNLLIERFLSRDYGEFPPAVRAKARLSCPRLAKREGTPVADLPPGMTIDEALAILDAKIAELDR